MKQLVFLSIAFIVNYTVSAQQPKVIADCTLKFSIKNLEEDSNSDIGSKTVYIKGKDIRVDLTSQRLSQSFFYDSKAGNVTVLKVIGQSKYVSYYNMQEWQKQNAVYNGIKIKETGKTKKILSYDCKEAVLTLTNGTTYTIYFYPGLVPSVVENPFEFKDVPGLVLEYESSIKNKTIVFQVQKIDFDPVPSMEFEIDTKGYRLFKPED